jgi:flagellar protein FliS
MMTSSDKNTLLYKENNIASARPEDLTLMMYNGLMKFIARAQEEIRAKSLEAAHNTLIRCQDIVFEFQYTLNMDYAMSNNLMLLYDYLYNRLIEANAKKDCDILDEVQGFVAELRDTWVEAVRLNKEQKTEAAEAAAAEAAAEAEAEVEAAAAAVDVAASKELESGAAAISDSGAAAEPGNAVIAAVAADAAAAQTVSRTKAIYTRSSKPAFAASAAAATVTVAASTVQKPFNRVNNSAAAQYAKVSKAKASPREIISIASE